MDIYNLEKGKLLYYVDYQHKQIKQALFNKVEDIGYHSTGLDVVFLEGVEGHFLSHEVFHCYKDAKDKLMTSLKIKEKVLTDELAQIREHMNRIESESNYFE